MPVNASSPIARRTCRPVLARCVRPLLWLALAALAGPHVRAQGAFETLAEFARPGSQPLATLANGADGFLYGTTAAGGSYGAGTLFRLDSNGTLASVHSFSGPDGQAPTAALARADDGSLWGTCAQGGSLGFGCVFRLGADGSFAKAADFTGPDGARPGSVPGALVRHSNGFLYGVAEAGGSSQNGIVFRIDPTSWEIATLASFTGVSGALPGSAPVGPLAVSGANLYGATLRGGSGGFGVLFRIRLDGSSAAALVHLTGATGAAPGRAPTAGPTLANDGFLYGATEYGGANGVGVAYRLSPSDGAFTLLRSFDDGGGSQPAGPLAQASNGDLYGTVATGGGSGFGGIFRLQTSGAYALLASFSGSDGALPGASPRSGVALATDGLLYATASAGGPGQGGAIVSITAGGVVASSAFFSSGAGWFPAGAPLAVADGQWLGPMAEGGSLGAGTIARFDSQGTLLASYPMDPSWGGLPLGGLLREGADVIALTTRQGFSGRGAAIHIDPSGTISAIASLTSTSGDFAQGPLLRTADGSLFSVSAEGGLSGNGALFKIDANNALTRVFSFSGTSGGRMGRRPLGPLVQTADGTIYGVCQYGGTDDSGTLFRVASDGSSATVVSFPIDGPRRPEGGLVLTADGSLVGTLSRGGGADAGAVFRFDPATQNLSILAECGGTPIAQPLGTPTVASDGTIYGAYAGANGGAGGIFRWRSGLGLDVLSAFSGYGGSQPGFARAVLNPGATLAAAVSLGPDGSLFGFAPAGGAGGGGVFFRIRMDEPFTVWKKTFPIDAGTIDTADLDHDGIPLLIEYALDLSPVAPDRHDLVEPVLANGSGGAWLSFALPRDSAKTDITVSIEAADSLSGPWTSIATSHGGAPFTGTATVTETPAGLGRFAVTARDSLALTQGAARFLRLSVVR